MNPIVAWGNGASTALAIFPTYTLARECIEHLANQGWTVTRSRGAERAISPTGKRVLIRTEPLGARGIAVDQVFIHAGCDVEGLLLAVLPTLRAGYQSAVTVMP